MTSEILLRGGTVLDGTGAAGRTADVAVSEGRVLAVGTNLPTAAARVLDVSGAVVCPGFIDLHSHADFTVMGHPAATTQTLQGVTTLVTGNCGFSPFPVVPEHADELRALGAFLDDGLSWEWSAAGEYADAVDRLPLGINIAPQVGHGSLRIAAMGTADRAPTPAELERMRKLARESANAGVAGLSSGLVYPPSAYGETGELAVLVGEMAAHGVPLYSTHMRNESARLLAAVEEAIAVARQAGARLQISHLKAAARPTGAWWTRRWNSSTRRGWKGWTWPPTSTRTAPPAPPSPPSCPTGRWTAGFPPCCGGSPIRESTGGWRRPWRRGRSAPSGWCWPACRRGRIAGWSD
jgi:N-acyl-D-amino-acid deacylase